MADMRPVTILSARSHISKMLVDDQSHLYLKVGSV